MLLFYYSNVKRIFKGKGLFYFSIKDLAASIGVLDPE